MSVPNLSHLQFAVLAVLLDGEQPGRVLRDRLAEGGISKSGPGFYQLMARLEEDGLVEGWYVQKEVAGQMIKERTYRITGAGEAAWSRTREFYCSHGRLGLLPASPV
jgi:DNA-binding PadR family transcriptional regulator